jgi:hypothetical protein
MTDPTKARIYLAAARHYFEDESFRRYATHPREGCGGLCVLNDETLAGGATVAPTAGEGSLRVIVPLAGCIQYKDDRGNGALVEACQVLSAFVDSKTKFEIRNVYGDRAVRLLNISFSGGKNACGDLQIDNFDLTTFQNQLLPIVSRKDHSLWMGKFDGRREGTLRLGNEGAFVHIVHGAFEVQNRLLETGDGLSVWSTDLLEFEALSNEAIIAVLPF